MSKMVMYMGYFNSGLDNMTETFPWSWRDLGALSDVCWINTDSGVSRDRLAFLGHVTKGCFLSFF